jgi:hypothetical protein
MRALVFEGKFGHIKEASNKGTVVFCHFEPNDNDKIINKAAKKFSKISKDNLILVPFAHLFEKNANKKDAYKYFEYLISQCKKSKLTILSVPFGVEKEFFLYAPAKNSAIRFMKF